VQKLTPMAVKEKLEREHDKICFIDVRTEDEFLSGHVPGAMCVPLDKIENEQITIPQDRLLILSCQSGKRSARAKEILNAKGFTNLIEMDGGYLAWMKSGLPVNRVRKTIPVIRQALVAAGTVVCIGTILGILIHPAYLILPLVMGAGLMFAGITGKCGLVFLLERMPWNRNFPG